MRNYCFFALALLVLSCSDPNTQSPPSANGGATDVGNGGDGYTAEFTYIGYEIADILKKKPIGGVTSDQFLSAIRKTRVVSVSELTLKGAPVDAINYPEGTPARIELSRARWDEMKQERFPYIGPG